MNKYGLNQLFKNLNLHVCYYWSEIVGKKHPSDTMPVHFLKLSELSFKKKTYMKKKEIRLTICYMTISIGGNKECLSVCLPTDRNCFSKQQ